MDDQSKPLPFTQDLQIPWMWDYQLPYGSNYRLALVEKTGQYRAWPVALRGSKIAMQLMCREADLASRFLERIIRRSKLTTRYAFETNPGPEAYADIDALKQIVKTRYPRQRSGCNFLGITNFYRYQDGVQVRIDDEPDSVARYEAAQAMIKSDDFWLREAAMRELLSLAAKLKR